ncbi:MAG: response regulator [Candidatus Zixiibacteriota bacterium]
MEALRQKSILIVEDDENIRDFLVEVLDGYSLSIACDGDEAIDNIRDNRFDLVITDLRMPTIPGEEVVKYINENKPETKVIVISGYSSLYAVSQTVNNGASAFLSKPFSIKELLQTVSKILGS